MKKILIVDDDPAIGKLLKAAIEGARRFDVISVTSGAKGLAMAEQEQPAMIICDIDMPSMDGMSLATELAKSDKTKGIPLLFLSGLVTPQDVKRGVRADRWPTLSKRSPVSEIIEKVDEAIGTT